MHKEALKITVAGQLLSGICREDSTKSAAEREPELRNSLEIAETLIRMADGGYGPTLELNPPLLPPAPPVQERNIERPSLRSLLEERRSQQAGQPPVRRSRGPTLH